MAQNAYRSSVSDLSLTGCFAKVKERRRRSKFSCSEHSGDATNAAFSPTLCAAEPQTRDRGARSSTAATIRRQSTSPASELRPAFPGLFREKSDLEKSASSADFVGAFRLSQATRCVRSGDFHGFEGAEARKRAEFSNRRQAFSRGGGSSHQVRYRPAQLARCGTRITPLYLPISNLSRFPGRSFVRGIWFVPPAAPAAPRAVQRLFNQIDHPRSIALDDFLLR